MAYLAAQPIRHHVQIVASATCLLLRLISPADFKCSITTSLVLTPILTLGRDLLWCGYPRGQQGSDMLSSKPSQ